MNSKTSAITHITHFDQMKSSPYLAWTDTTEEGEVVTIQHYESVELTKQNPQPNEQKIEIKWVIYFEERDKGMILNKTNRERLKAIFNGVQDSIGQEVVLYYEEGITTPSGGVVNGLRLRRVKKAS